MKVQDVFTVGKLLALIMIILSGLYYMATGELENFRNPWEGIYTARNIGYASTPVCLPLVAGTT